jgi:hypothetical protein
LLIEVSPKNVNKDFVTKSFRGEGRALLPSNIGRETGQMPAKRRLQSNLILGILYLEQTSNRWSKVSGT